MSTTLFLQSVVANPYQLYAEKLAETPVYRDESSRLWAIYSYDCCKSILLNPTAYIPPINKDNRDGLDEHALLISGQVARLRNDVQHTIARQLATELLSRLKTIPIDYIVQELLQVNDGAAEIDWVETVARKCGVTVLLKGFGFNDADAYFISSNIALLIPVMLADKTPQQVKQINETSKEFYRITEQYLLCSSMYTSIAQSLEKSPAEPGALLAGCVSNLIGLFIQAYDAGRGLLSNALLHLADKNNDLKPGWVSKSFIEKSVVETLRFDSPVQNTRRIANATIVVNDTEIKKGETILLVLAAANRDPKKFVHPDKYNIDRSNNHEHLGFGTGHHHCIANHFSVYLATEVLLYFYQHYSNIILSEQTIEYEPIVNLRLPKRIRISFRSQQ